MDTSACPMVPLPPSTLTSLPSYEPEKTPPLFIEDPMDYGEKYSTRSRFEHHALDGIVEEQLDVLMCTMFEGEETVDVFIVNNDGAIPCMPSVFVVKAGKWVTTFELAKFLLITVISIKNVSIDALFIQKHKDSFMMNKECIDFFPSAVTGQETIVLQQEIVGAICAIRSTFFNVSSHTAGEAVTDSMEVDSDDEVEQPDFDGDLIPVGYGISGPKFMNADYNTNTLLL